MSAWTGLNNAIYSTTGSSSNIFVTGGYTSTGITFTNNSFANYPATDPVKSVADIAKETLRWVTDFCKKSPNFDESLKGFSALASRALYKSLVENEYENIRFGYIHNQQCSHVFCIIVDDHHYYKKEYIVDLCGSIFGVKEIVHEISKVDYKISPWWDTNITYESESGLISRQRKDGWPTQQVTFSAAKAKTLVNAFTLLETGHSNIDNKQLKILPFDSDSDKYLEKLSKGEGLKTNLAKLMRDIDPEIANAALKIAKTLSLR